jgi:hypothetical protein
MQSISSDTAKAQSRHPETNTVSLFSAEGIAFDPPDCRLNAEQELADNQEARRINQEVVRLFADDLVAQIMVEGMMEGMEGEELRATTELSKVGFASKRRLIRRRIETAHRHGSKS